MMPEYLTLEEVAALLRVPTRTARWWCTTGRLRSVRPGRHRLVRRRDLEQFVESTATGGRAAGSGS